MNEHLSRYLSSRRLKLFIAVSIAGLVVVLVNYFIVTQQRDRMLEDSRTFANAQMAHLTEEIKLSLQDGNYQSADRFLQDWGIRFTDVISLKLVAKNETVLSEFSRKLPDSQSITLEQRISYSYKGEARLVLVKGLGYVNKEVRKLLLQIFVISVIALTVFAVLVNEVLHRREIEKEIRENNDELELNIRERTSQLRQEVEARKVIEENLFVAKESAEKATRAKSEFLANMSHELRTPLNAILGYSETMTLETFGPINNEKYDEYLGIIHESGDHLLCLINEILDISAIEAGKLKLHEEYMDLDSMIETMIVLLKPEIEKKRQQLIYNRRDKLPQLHADPKRVRQIILNVVSNASRYTPDEGKITIEANLDEDNCIRFSVTDTGIGMTAEDIKTALEPFGQVHNPAATENRGAGLGLPLVKSLTEMHSGTMDIDSTPNVGTTVTITFPAGKTVTSTLR